jgi:hypothetical protein
MIKLVVPIWIQTLLLSLLSTNAKVTVSEAQEHDATEAAEVRRAAELLDKTLQWNQSPLASCHDDDEFCPF